MAGEVAKAACISSGASLLRESHISAIRRTESKIASKKQTVSNAGGPVGVAASR